MRLKNPGRNKSGTFLVLTTLTAVYLLTRLALILCSETRASHGEIPYIGSVSQGILQGWAKPFWDFQEVAYNGGYLVNGLLALPFFALLGSRMIALCLTAIFVNLCGMILLFLLCDRYYGRRAAIFAGLLYTFAPPLFTGYSVIYDGTFDWNPIFGIVMFFLFLNLMRTRKARDFFCLGLVSGFSVWHSYSNLVIIAGYSIIWLSREGLFFLKKRYLVYGAGLAAGFSPWFVFNLRNNFEGLDFLKFEGISRSNMLVKFHWLVSEGWRRMFIFDEFSAFKGAWFNQAYYWIFLVSAGYLIWLRARDKASREWELLIFPLTFALLYSASNKGFISSGWGLADYRYAMVMFVFLLMTIAIATARSWQDERIPVKVGGALAFVAVAFMGIIGNRGFVVSTDFKNRYLFLPGYYYQLAGEVAGRRNGFDLEKSRTRIDLVKSGPGRADAYMGYGRRIVWKAGRGRLDEALRLGGKIDPGGSRNFFYWGCGEGAALNFCQDQRNESLAEFFSGLNKLHLEQPGRDYLFAGSLEIFLNSGGRLFIPVPVEQLLPAIGPRYRGIAYFLAGCNKGSRLPWMNPDEASKSTLTDPLAGDHLYARGLGAGMAAFYSGDMAKVERFAKKTGIDPAAVSSGASLYLFDPKQPEHTQEALARTLEECR